LTAEFGSAGTIAELPRPVCVFRFSVSGWRPDQRVSCRTQLDLRVRKGLRLNLRLPPLLLQFPKELINNARTNLGPGVATTFLSSGTITPFACLVASGMVRASGIPSHVLIARTFVFTAGTGRPNSENLTFRRLRREFLTPEPSQRESNTFRSMATMLLGCY